MFTSWWQKVFLLHQENSLGWNSLSFPLFFLSCLPLSPFYLVFMWVLVVSDSLRPHGRWPTSLLCPWDFPGKKTAVGSLPSSRGSSRPRDQGHISFMSCTGRWIPYHLESPLNIPSFLLKHTQNQLNPKEHFKHLKTNIISIKGWIVSP